MSELFPQRDPAHSETILRHALAEERARYPEGFSATERAALYVLADDLALSSLVRRAILFAARYEPGKDKATERSPRTP